MAKGDALSSHMYDPKQWQGCGIFFDDILSIVSTSVIFL